jgi:hypothetical protein
MIEYAKLQSHGAISPIFLCLIVFFTPPADGFPAEHMESGRMRRACRAMTLGARTTVRLPAGLFARLQAFPVEHNLFGKPDSTSP